MEDCVFCRMVAKDIGCDLVAERPNAIAVRDINPQAPVHVLILPREHISSVQQLGAERCDLLTDVFALVNEITVSEGIAQTGFRLVLNSGEDGGQDVDHIHFHLLGGRFMGWPPG